MPKGLDYIINLKNGTFGGVQAAKTQVQGLDNAVEGIGKSVTGLGPLLSKASGMIIAAFAFQGISEYTSEARALYKETKLATAQIAQGITTTAGVAGQSLAHLKEQAEKLEHTTLFGEGEILRAQSQLLTFTNIRGEIFDKTIPAIMGLATRMGGNGPADLAGSLLQVSKALQGPMDGIASLGRVGVKFSDQQKAMIANDIKHGQMQKAQAIILKELSTEFGGSAEAARKAMGIQGDLNEENEKLKRTYGELFGAVKSQITPALLGLVKGVSESIPWFKAHKDTIIGITKVLAVGAAVWGIYEGAIWAASTATALYNGVLAIGNTLSEIRIGYQLATAEGMGVMAAAQWALNAAMDANPVGLIVLGIAALASGIYYAYQKSETFRAVLSGIGAIASELVPVFKGLGEIILGALTMNPAMVIAGFKDAYDGVKKVIADGGISGAFNKGFDESIAKSQKDAADEANKKKAESATSLFGENTGKQTPYAISTGKGKKGSGDDSTSISGGTSVRHVTVTINKLVETLIVKNTSIANLKPSDVKRQLAELLTEAVHDSELALGSQ